MQLTQKELVDKLGISRGTLYRVLTNSPLVKGVTRDRVLAELSKLNYTPNLIAQGLKTKRTRTIGIIGPAAMKISNIDKISSLHHAARERGYSVIFGYSDGTPEGEVECIRDLKSRMVDGFVALGRGLSESVPHYQALIDSGSPLVTLYPIPGLETDCVYVDTKRAFNELTTHLIKLGHKNIGLLLDNSSSLFTSNREFGFREAMETASLFTEEKWIIRVSPDGSSSGVKAKNVQDLGSVSDYQLGFWGTEILLSENNRPTALVCFSDEYAIGALRAADLAGVKVPTELALVGYDDKEPARFARVPLTTMHQPDEQIGMEALTMLIDRIEGKLSPEAVIRTLPAQLVIRESSGSKSLT